MISQILDRQTYAKLSERDIEFLSAVIDAELLKNPEVHKILKKVVDPHISPQKKKS